MAPPAAQYRLAVNRHYADHVTTIPVDEPCSRSDEIEEGGMNCSPDCRAKEKQRNKSIMRVRSYIVSYRKKTKRETN